MTKKDKMASKEFKKKVIYQSNHNKNKNFNNYCNKSNYKLKNKKAIKNLK